MESNVVHKASYNIPKILKHKTDIIILDRRQVFWTQRAVSRSIEWFVEKDVSILDSITLRRNVIPTERRWRWTLDSMIDYITMETVHF